VLRNPFAFAFIFLLDYIAPAIAITTAIAIHFAIERLVCWSVFFVEAVYLLQVSVVTVVSISTHSLFCAVLRNPFAFAFIFLLDYIGPAIAIATAIAIHFAIERLVCRSVFFVETVYLLQVCCNRIRHGHGEFSKT
jgi:hypothetical protein